MTWSRLAPRVLVVALLAASTAAFVFTERLKLEESPIRNARIDPLISPVCTACPPSAREAPIAFRLLREDDVTIDIVGEQGHVVREALVSGRLLPRFHRFSWDGRDGRGRVVADGLYRARVRLAGEGRTLEVPHEIRVDATAPSIEGIELRPAVISPDSDRRSDRVSIDYRFSEPARAILYVNGRPTLRSFRRRPAGVIQWYARGLSPGTYRLALAGKDRAGNVSPSTREFTVRLRYVELRRRVFRARPRALLRLSVSTDATEVRFALARLGGGRRFSGRVRARRPPVRRIVLYAPRRPGRYRLTVTANGRSARALVVVSQ